MDPSDDQRDHNEKRSNSAGRKELAWRTVPCRWWQSNSCKKGKDCKFAHVDAYGFDWHETDYNENRSGSQFKTLVPGSS